MILAGAAAFLRLKHGVRHAAMKSRTTRPSDPRVSLSFLLLALLLATLWLAGGASRGDVMGKVIVQAVAWTAMVVAIVLPQRFSFHNLRMVALLLAAIVALPLLQLIPLPPSLWQTLPGRDPVAQTALQILGELPWGRLSLSPGNTINAASSLVVAAVVLLSLSGLQNKERTWLISTFLVLVIASMLVALAQFSLGRFDQPLINYTGDISGTFANRNHFALFMGLGCLTIPLWALRGDHRHFRWRLLAAAGMLLLFILTALASGSRAGLVLMVMALPIGILIVREDATLQMRDQPRWIRTALLLGGVSIIILVIGLSIMLDRAVSIDRLLTANVGQDMRVRGSGTVLLMMYEYFPAGTGLGSFDPLFRIHEPFALLKQTYFNRAHDDFIEIVLDSGVAGLLVLASALTWWMWASWRTWFGKGSSVIVLGRLGSAMLLLVFLASIVDYPARTPLMMAIVTIAAAMLAWGAAAACENVDIPRNV